MTRTTQRNLRLLGYTLLDLGVGVLLGVALALSSFIYALQAVA